MFSCCRRKVRKEQEQATDVELQPVEEKGRSTAQAGKTTDQLSWLALTRVVKYDVLAQDKDHLMGRFAWGADVSNDGVSRRLHELSFPAQRINFFCSYCWTDDGESFHIAERQKADFKKNMADAFAAKQRAEFENQVKEQIARLSLQEAEGKQDGNKSGTETAELTFWMDKACVPQFDKVRKVHCVEHFEEFVSISEGAIVLLSAKYLTRLWCIYEWACFLRYLKPRHVFVGFWGFLANSAAHFYDPHFAALRALSLESLQCTREEDRPILLRKVDEDRPILLRKVEQFYVSPDAFVRLVRLSVIALIVRDLMLGIGKYNEDAFGIYIEPWLSLATELEFPELVGLVRGFNCPKKWEQCDLPGLELDHIQGEYARKHLVPFLEGQLYPILDRLQQQADEDSMILKCNTRSPSYRVL
eukprot:g67598.t1